MRNAGNGSALRLVTAEIAAVVLNVVPLALWFFEEQSAETTMVIYAFECAAAILLAMLCVAIISPSYDAGGSTKYKRKSKLLADYAVIAGGLFAACGIFMSGFIFLVLKAEVNLKAAGMVFLALIGFQVAEFAVNVFTLRPLPLRKAEFVLTRGLGRTVLLFFGIFIGAFLAAFADEYFIIPFIVLKTIVDIGEPIQFFMGKEEPLIPAEFGIHGD